jgi:hypothetical protein
MATEYTLTTTDRHRYPVRLFVEFACVNNQKAMNASAMMLCWCDITRHSPEHPKTVLSKSRHAAGWRAIAGDQEDFRTV